MDTLINAKLEDADTFLANAKEGLCKPEEDVVPYYVCDNAHKAILHLLTAYVQRNGHKLPVDPTVRELLALCRGIDPVFDELHLSPFYHPTDTEDIWMNLDTASDFLTMAEKTQELVLSLVPKN